MILSAVLQVIVLLVPAFGVSSSTAVGECPLATLTCKQNPSNQSEYACTVLAHYPSERNAPQYSWAVSGGKIAGDPKSPNITVAVDGLRRETVTVKAKVHWRRISRVCDVSLSEKITLRP